VRPHTAMEAISLVPDEDRMKMSDEWASAVRKMVDVNEMLDIFCVERSISQHQPWLVVSGLPWMKLATCIDGCR